MRMSWRKWWMKIRATIHGCVQRLTPSWTFLMTKRLPSSKTGFSRESYTLTSMANAVSATQIHIWDSRCSIRYTIYTLQLQKLLMPRSSQCTVSVEVWSSAVIMSTERCWLLLTKRLSTLWLHVVMPKCFHCNNSTSTTSHEISVRKGLPNKVFLPQDVFNVLEHRDFPVFW